MAKILLVEDDTFLRKIYTIKLKEVAEWEVITATNGLEALKVIQSSQVDLILLDLVMPEMGGFELLQKIKSDSNLNSIPVIITSGLGQESDVKKALEMGACDYLTKSDTTMNLLIDKVKINLSVLPNVESSPVVNACANCHTKLANDAKFCSNCGQAIQAL